MNISLVMSNAKKEIGLGKFLKSERTDTELVNQILLPITLTEFSRYFKNRIMMYDVSLTRLNESGLYEIDLGEDFFKSIGLMGMKIKGIDSIKPNRKRGGLPFNNYYNGPFYSPVAPIGSMGTGMFSLEQTAKAFLHESAMESMDLGLNFKFIEPNKIQFYNQDIFYDNHSYDLTILTTHATNLSTLPDSIASSFMNLFKLDLKRILYESEFKYLDGVETPYTKIDLKLNGWDQAENLREQLIASWKANPFANNTMIVGV